MLVTHGLYEDRDRVAHGYALGAMAGVVGRKGNGRFVLLPLGKYPVCNQLLRLPREKSEGGLLYSAQLALTGGTR